MNIIQAIIFGLVEGITEFLPISSTAHLDITRLLLGLPSSDFIKSFQIAIQLGAILAVVWLYRQKIFSSCAYMKNILIAFIPTGVIGFVLYKIIKTLLLGNNFIAAIMLIVGGVLILWFEKKTKQAIDTVSIKIEDLKLKQLILLGTAQALAVVPGVSRSLSVILAGRTQGLSRSLIAEFSFLLAIPTMLAATVYDLYKSGVAFSEHDWVTLFIGFTISFVTALWVVRWLIGYVQKNSFEIFGWYRIFIGIVLLVFLFLTT